MMLDVNLRKCPAMEDICKAIPACPVRAISYITDENAKLGGRIIIDEALCDGCGICIDACCGKAISSV